MTTLRAELEQLSPAERLLLAEELWDSIAEDMHGQELSPELKAELDRRLVAYQKNPEAVTAWAEVKKGLQRR